MRSLLEGNFYPDRLVLKRLKKVWQATSVGKKHGIDRTNTLILDDTPSTYRENYANAIPIRTWNGHDAADSELKILCQRLEKMAARERVREPLREKRIQQVDVLFQTSVATAVE